MIDARNAGNHAEEQARVPSRPVAYEKKKRVLLLTPSAGQAIDDRRGVPHAHHLLLIP
jgi:hypothetical protein